jgi:SNF2 family DNA or RNA helicase
MSAVLKPADTFAALLREIGVQGTVPGADQVRLLKTPKPHQAAALKAALSYKNLRYGLYDDPGTGKSFISYLFALFYMLQGNKVLALMPPILIRQYATKIHEMLDLGGLPLSLHALEEELQDRRALFEGWNRDGWPDLLAMSYQKFLRIYKELPRDDYPVLVADEAHVMKSADSLSHQKVEEFLGAEGEKAFLAMTGTAMPTDLECAYGLIRLVTPEAYHSKRSFDMRHLIKVMGPRIMVRGKQSGRLISRQTTKVVGFRNRELLSQNLYRQGRRITIDQVLPLERPTVIEIDVDLAQAHRRLYRKLVQERMLEVGESVVDAVQFQALRMHCLKMIANPELYTDKPIRNAVYEALDQIFETVNVRENKILVFAWFQVTIERLAERYRDLNPALIYGGSDSEENKWKFIRDPDCRVCFANPDSGGVGVDNLQDVCSTVVFCEAVSTPKSFEQGIARVHRQGQTRPVRGYVFRVHGTVGSNLLDVMLRRVADRQQVLLDKQTVLDTLLGVA